MADAQLVNLGRVLNQRAIDKVVNSSGVFRKAGWTPAKSLHLDLEAVEFIDFSAAGRFVALMEALLRRDFELEITLPNPERRGREQLFMDGRIDELSETQQDRARREIEGRIEARGRASSFARHIGMIASLRMEHLPERVRGNINLVERDQSSLGSNINTDGLPSLSTIGGSAVRGFPAILPLQWIGTRDQLHDIGWQETAVAFLYDQGLALTQSDAESLVTTVFRELLENVMDHATIGDDPVAGALFGAIQLNRSKVRYHPHDGDSYPCAESYLTWLGNQETPILRIVVADSGFGLSSSLRPRFFNSQSSHAYSVRRAGPGIENRRIVQYAFQAKVSRHERGYRRGVGLTIVRRFIRHYRGMALVRCSNVVAGFECHEDQPQSVSADGMQYVPGTSIELFLGLGLRERERARDSQPVVLELTDVVTIDAVNLG